MSAPSTDRIPQVTTIASQTIPTSTLNDATVARTEADRVETAAEPGDERASTPTAISFDRTTLIPIVAERGLTRAHGREDHAGRRPAQVARRRPRDAEHHAEQEVEVDPVVEVDPEELRPRRSPRRSRSCRSPAAGTRGRSRSCREREGRQRAGRGRRAGRLSAATSNADRHGRRARPRGAPATPASPLQWRASAAVNARDAHERDLGERQHPALTDHDGEREEQHRQRDALAQDADPEVVEPERDREQDECHGERSRSPHASRSVVARERSRSSAGSARSSTSNCSRRKPWYARQEAEHDDERNARA